MVSTLYLAIVSREKGREREKETREKPDDRVDASSVVRCRSFLLSSGSSICDAGAREKVWIIHSRGGGRRRRRKERRFLALVQKSRRSEIVPPSPLAKSSIPRPLARFALVSDTALRATIAENRLVSKAPPKPNVVAFSACDDRDDDDVAATAFDDFLCETTRGICDDAHALVACANMMCAMSTTPSLCTNLCVRDFYARKKQSPFFFFFFSSFLSLDLFRVCQFSKP